MGRRSINTTKSGKYMNPTDQARKEARKKELKKNKKQRQMVRAAVLKGKDPQQLIVDLEKIDEMEFNVLQPSPLNEKVLKDKRKKLKETLDRVLKLYSKDDPDKYGELRRAQLDYEKKRSAIVNLYESVKNAQDVQLEEIPLPINVLTPELQAVISGLPSHIPLPPQMAMFRPPRGILKNSNKKKVPPGVPPGPPPDLEEFAVIRSVYDASVTVPQKKSIRFAGYDPEPEEMDAEVPAPPVIQLAEESTTENVENDIDTGEKNAGEDEPKPTTLQQKLLAMSGQNVDEFMREMEEVNRKRKAAQAADLDARLAALDDQADEDEDSFPPTMMAPSEMMPGGPPHPMAGMPGMMFRPPPRGVPSLMGIRLPPGPPPGLPPRLNLRMPPGPPPGLPPRLLRPPGMPMGPPVQMNTLSAAPQLINRPDGSGPTIQANAKMRNLSADVTRFVPSSLRNKREEKNKTKIKPFTVREPTAETLPPVRPGQTKDDAYLQFMREMESLM